MRSQGTLLSARRRRSRRRSRRRRGARRRPRRWRRRRAGHGWRRRPSPAATARESCAMPLTGTAWRPARSTRARASGASVRAPAMSSPSVIDALPAGPAASGRAGAAARWCRRSRSGSPGSGVWVTTIPWPLHPHAQAGRAEHAQRIAPAQPAHVRHQRPAADQRERRHARRTCARVSPPDRRASTTPPWPAPG